MHKCVKSQGLIYFVYRVHILKLMNVMTKPTIVYDGDCPFCQRQMALVRRLDKRAVFDYLPKQSNDLLNRFPQLDQMDFETGLRLVDVKGRVFVGADAVYEIGSRLTPCKYIAWLYLIPGLRQIGQHIYKLIAANRGRF